MRAVVGILSCLALLLVTPPVHAQEAREETRVEAKFLGGASAAVGGTRTSSVTGPGEGGEASSVSTRGAAVFYGSRYRIASDQGQPCIDLSVGAFADQARMRPPPP